MQDRYVGDIGDFGKYGLLRYLCGVTGPKVDNPLRLGVVWYFNNDGSSGGGATGYLYTYSPLAQYDQFLYAALRDLLSSDEKRKVSEVERAGILPDSTTYFREIVSQEPQRDNWFLRALCKTEKADLVFLDPDMGLEKQTDKGPKYVRIGEIESFIKREQSLVMYQHASQNPELDRNRIQRFQKEINQPVWVFQWTNRYFLIIPSEKHKQELWDRLKAFVGGSQPWGIMPYPLEDL